MAWRCSSSTNAGLVSNLVAASICPIPKVAEAMLATDRANYVPSRSNAYMDAPEPLSHGATISAPHMHASLACALHPLLDSPPSRVLDIGSGSGYLCAVLLRAGASEVVGVEHIDELQVKARESLKKDGLAQELERGNIKVITADGRLGYPPRAPYSAIHVGAAARGGIPPALLEQLASPGRLVIPVETAFGDQEIIQVDKDASGKVTKSSLMGVRYVPLCDEAEQRGGRF